MFLERNISFYRLFLSFVFILCCLSILFFPTEGYALTPPKSGDLKQYEKDGTLSKRIKFAEKIGNDKPSPFLLTNLYRNLRNLHEGGRDASQSLPANWIGLPTVGSPKVLVMLVDFPEYPHTSSQTVDEIKSKFFGDGDQKDAPYESLTNFYKRSSYGKLSIKGDVIGWYRAKHSRSYYEKLSGPIDSIGQDTLIKEVVQYYADQGRDFKQYDNNNDGKIDGIYIKWAGPDKGWSSFWWAYQWSFQDPSFKVQGKKLGSYVWSWYENEKYEGSVGYHPHTDIHETGHLLGLPDYYDYDDEAPHGGVGGLDIMDGNWGDHNSFSKFMLGWMTPTVISSGEKKVDLHPLGSHGESVLIMPNAKADTPYQEFYMAEYRKRSVGNDPGNFPTDGMLIWHVDAGLTSDGSDFLYNNQYTDHKLLRLMEADGLEQIENESGYWAEAGDFYQASKTIGSDTFPNSRDYAGKDTGILISDISVPGSTMSASFSLKNGEVPSSTKTVTVEKKKTLKMKITGGSTPYKSTSSTKDIATVNIKGSILEIKGIKEGTSTITIKDANNTELTLQVVVMSMTLQFP